MNDHNLLMGLRVDVEEQQERIASLEHNKERQEEVLRGIIKRHDALEVILRRGLLQICKFIGDDI